MLRVVCACAVCVCIYIIYIYIYIHGSCMYCIVDATALYSVLYLFVLHVTAPVGNYCTLHRTATLYTPPYMHTVHYTVQPHCTLHRTLYTLHSTRYTVHSTLYTLIHTPSTLNPQPSTLNPQLDTLSPQPSTLSSKSLTPRPQPYTLISALNLRPDDCNAATDGCCLWMVSGVCGWYLVTVLVSVDGI